MKEPKLDLAFETAGIELRRLIATNNRNQIKLEISEKYKDEPEFVKKFVGFVDGLDEEQFQIFYAQYRKTQKETGK